jgi:hypothetical protein
MTSMNSEYEIEKLMAIYGVTEQEASWVLEESGGDVNRAASLLDDAVKEEATNFAENETSESAASNDAKLKLAELKVGEDASATCDDSLEYTPTTITTDKQRGATMSAGGTSCVWPNSVLSRVCFFLTTCFQKSMIKARPTLL